MENINIGIIGLGLMGGSLGKTLKNVHSSFNIIGYDINQKHIEQALILELIDSSDSFENILKSDIIFLCIPVNGILSIMSNLEKVSNTTTIVDFGSTKELISSKIPPSIRENFILAHPMTGTEKSGPTAAFDDLYKNQNMVICDIDLNSSLHQERILDIIYKLKMRPIFMDSKTHDVHACYISHLPHVISFGLANVVMNHETPKEIISLAAGGFKDMSRIAKSNPNMWAGIFKQNKSNILKSLKEYQNHMEQFQNLLENDQFEDIIQWMKKANTLHEII